MSSEKILLRQQRLIVRSTQLRSEIAVQSQVFIKPLAFADKVREGLTWIYQNPTLPFGVMLVFLVLKPKKAIAWGSRLWWAWNTLKRLQRVVGRT